MSIERISRILWWMTGVLCVWTIFLWFLPSHTTVWNFLYNALYGLIYLFGGGIGLFFWHTVQHQGVRQLIRFSGASMMSYAIGQGIWTWYNVVWHIEIPDSPSLPDMFFLGFYFPLIIGLLSLVRLYLPVLSPRIIFETAVIVICTSSITIFFFGIPSFSDGGFFANLIMVLYPLGDMLLLTIAIVILRVGGGKIHTGVLTFVLALIVITMGDFLYIYRYDEGVYWNGGPVDMLLGAGGSMLSFGLLQMVKEFSPLTSPGGISIERSDTQGK